MTRLEHNSNGLFHFHNIFGTDGIWNSKNEKKAVLLLSFYKFDQCFCSTPVMLTHSFKIGLQSVKLK